jgi:hypothetical protein
MGTRSDAVQVKCEIFLRSRRSVASFGDRRVCGEITPPEPHGLDCRDNAFYDPHHIARRFLENRIGPDSDQSATIEKSRDPRIEPLTTRLRPHEIAGRSEEVWK